MSTAIHVVNVTHRYAKGGTTVLSDVALRVEAGETLAIVGESGCGKSTLLHMIAGMETPAAGAVYIGGEPVRSPNPRWNIMFQRAALYPWLSIVDNVALGLEFAGEGRERRHQAVTMLQRVGLGDRVNARPQDLSGGQQQRVALARSLVVSPSVILLDEPFSALDTFTRSDLQAEVLSIVAEQGITLIQVTHDLDEAVIMGDRIAVMERGPGRIHSLIDNRMTAPRQPGRPGFAAMRDELLAAFGRARRNPLPDDEASTPASVAVSV